ncbi:MAG TPA: hypothetical protein VII45_10010 [Solirubrobacterales bacterium]
MDDLSSVNLTEALLRLQALIGSEIKATVNLYGQFFGCGMQGRLLRVETLPPDHSAINLVIDGAEGVFLDPADGETFAGPGPGECELLEFRLAYGVSVAIEPMGVAHAST